MNKPPWIIENRIEKPQIEFLRKKKLLIATPAFGGLVYTNYVQSFGNLTTLAARIQLPMSSLFLANESLIQRARNICASDFLDSDATHLMFIDADIGFDPKDVISMLLADKPIIGGVYTKKCIDFEKAFKAHERGVPSSHLGHCAGKFVVRFENKSGVEIFQPTPVKYLGTGFLMISREALEAVAKVVPSYVQNSDPRKPGKRHSNIFAVDIVNDELLSEDYWFCYKAKDLGFELFMAPWVHLTHTGTHTHDGCLLCSSGHIIHNLGQPMEKP